MIALPTIFLTTKTNRLFTIPSTHNPDERCICLFATMKAASKFKKRIQPIANNYHPVDLKERAIIQIFDLWENCNILWFAVFSSGEVGEDILFYKIERPAGLLDDAEPIAD